MKVGGDNDTWNLLEHVLAPVADEDGARRTALALARCESARPTALHGLKEWGGVPDHILVEQCGTLAVGSFDAIRGELPITDEHTASSRDVVTANSETAGEGEEVLGDRSHRDGQHTHYLFGGFSLNPVAQPNRPETAGPGRESSE